MQNEVGPRISIDQIRDYVQANKPIAATVAKDWMRYLLSEYDRKEQRVQRLVRSRYRHVIND